MRCNLINSSIRCRSPCPTARAWMPFRSSFETFGPALRPGSSTGVLHHVMLRGIERRAFTPVFGVPPQSVCRAAQLSRKARAEWNRRNGRCRKWQRFPLQFPGPCPCTPPFLGFPAQDP